MKVALDKGADSISYQVIQEFLNVSSRKFESLLTYQDSQILLSIVLEPLCEVYASIDLFHRALEISQQWKYSFYDSLIIAAALQNNCPILYSEDLKNGQIIHELKIVNPFNS